MRKVRVIGAVMAAIAVAACASAPAAPSTSISAEAKEFSFRPAAWTVPAGQQVSVTFTNAGTTDHEWVIIADQRQLTSEAEFSETMVYFEIEFLGNGRSTTATFTAPSAGTYQVICAVPGHFDRGMKGTLTVAP